MAGDRERITRAAAILTAGGLVAIPTETVYGLAANALDPEAVRRIFVAKGRPQDNPLIVHITDTAALTLLAKEIPQKAIDLFAAFSPGPLTVILKKTTRVPAVVSAGLDTVAIRIPAHPVARALIEAAGVPLAAPSANLSGSPSPTRPAHVLADLTGRVEGIVLAGDCGVGVESTVISLVGAVPRLLRPGLITPEQIESVIGSIEVDRGVVHQLAPDELPLSPGMKYKHYAPKASVAILRGSLAAYCSYVNARAADGVYALCFTGEERHLRVPCVSYGGVTEPQQQARLLFDALRELDAQGAKQVYARCPAHSGVGLAVYNRLLRAAGFSVVDLEESFA